MVYKIGGSYFPSPIQLGGSFVNSVHLSNSVLQSIDRQIHSSVSLTPKYSSNNLSISNWHTQKYYNVNWNAVAKTMNNISKSTSSSYISKKYEPTYRIQSASQSTSNNYKSNSNESKSWWDKAKSTLGIFGKSDAEKAAKSTLQTGTSTSIDLYDEIKKGKTLDDIIKEQLEAKKSSESLGITETIANLDAESAYEWWKKGKESGFTNDKIEVALAARMARYQQEANAAGMPLEEYIRKVAAEERNQCEGPLCGIEKILNEYQNSVTGGIKEGLKAIAAPIVLAFEGLKDVLDDIFEFLKNVGDYLYRIVKPFLDIIQEWYEDIRDKAIEILDDMKTFFSEKLKSIADVFGSAIEWLLEKFGWVYQHLKEGFDALVEWLKEHVVSPIRYVYEIINEKFGWIWETARSILETIIGKAKEIIKLILGLPVYIALKIFEKVRPYLQRIWDWFKETYIDPVVDFLKKAKDVLEEVVPPLVGILKKFVEFLDMSPTEKMKALRELQEQFEQEAEKRIKEWCQEPL